MGVARPFTSQFDNDPHALDGLNGRELECCDILAEKVRLRGEDPEDIVADLSQGAGRNAFRAFLCISLINVVICVVLGGSWGAAGNNYSCYSYNYKLLLTTIKCTIY